MTKLLKSSMVVILLLGPVACDTWIQGSREVIEVYSLLDPHRQTRVFVSRAINVSSFEGRIEVDSVRTAISGANVMITCDSGSVRLTEIEPGVYVDLDRLIRWIQGGTYELAVETPDGDLLTATTALPLEPALVGPQPFDTLRIDYVVDTAKSVRGWDSIYAENDLPVLRWTDDPASGGYDISLFDSLGSGDEEIAEFIGYANQTYPSWFQTEYSVAVGPYPFRLGNGNNMWNHRPDYLEFDGWEFHYLPPSEEESDAVLEIRAFAREIIEGGAIIGLSSYDLGSDGQDYGDRSNVEGGYGLFTATNKYSRPVVVHTKFRYTP
jgi:hypothetical protein